jgi:hypothetical protein
MSKDLFKRTRSLLQDHIRILNEHRIGDTHVEDAEAIISEIELLLKSDAVDKIEDQIDEVERMIISDDLAQEILNARYCVGGSCDD